MKVTEVRINLVNSEKSVTKAFAAVTFDEELVVKGIRVVEGKKGLFVAMPSSKGSDDKYYDNVFPLEAELREDISEAVLDAYDKAEEKPKKKSRR